MTPFSKNVTSAAFDRRRGSTTRCHHNCIIHIHIYTVFLLVQGIQDGCFSTGASNCYRLLQGGLTLRGELPCNLFSRLPPWSVPVEAASAGRCRHSCRATPSFAADSCYRVCASASEAARSSSQPLFSQRRSSQGINAQRRSYDDNSSSSQRQQTHTAARSGYISRTRGTRGARRSSGRVIGRTRPDNHESDG